MQYVQYSSGDLNNERMTSHMRGVKRGSGMQKKTE